MRAMRSTSLSSASMNAVLSITPAMSAIEMSPWSWCSCVTCAFESRSRRWRTEMDRRAEWRRHADAAVAVERALEEDRPEENGNGRRGKDVIEADPCPPAEPSASGPRLGCAVSVEEGD